MGEVGESTRGSLGEEVTRFSFGVSMIKEDLLARFEREFEGCGVASVAYRWCAAVLLPGPSGLSG